MQFGKGAVGGLIATVPMTLLMFAWHRKLPNTQRYPLPPSLITKRMFGRTPIPGKPAPMPNLAATLAAHFGFGAATGALFAAVPRELRQQYHVAAGVGYGLCVWAGSYMGWVPGMGLMPPVARQPVPRNSMMIAAHMVWGATLGFALKALSAGQPNLRSAQRAPRAPPRTLRHDLRDVGVRTATSKQGHAHGST
jgi:hypothetical protein